MVVQYRNGYPIKISIEKLLDECGVDAGTIQFCADYTIKRAGILWKAHSLDDKLKEFCNLAENNGIKISRTKFFGQIHSIWFEKQKDENND